MRNSKVIIGLILVMITCGRAGASAREDDSDLSLSEAQSRKARLSAITYDLQVTLDPRNEKFSGKSRIAFDLKESPTPAPLRLDFFLGEVSRLKLNGKPLPLSAKKKYWIELPASALHAGQNQLEVDYRQKYSHESRGLHKFVDPKTHDVFLFTNFEPFDANRFMPCFDQPDLRATLTLQVEAPTSWQVISTTRETSTTPQAKHRKLWKFPPTAKLATYLFSLHAGPYQVWTDQYEDIPLRLFARPQMAKYVSAKDWFRWTKGGLKYYNDYFAYKYPFKKYDQVIVPEFPDAMENVAAVIFTEDYLSRSEATRPQQRTIAEVLLHEMAHMWFGNTVTMSWWNGLWLNESFATFMSALALADTTEFHESWEHFHSEYKNWAYHEDELNTTHPVESPILKVKEANALFDGVTYGKGASVLKQLSAYMTPAKFRQGLQEYIRTYAYQNADRQGFIASLQTHTPHDLNLWAKRWLEQSGTDRLTTKWTCNGDRLERIDLTLTPERPAEFRPQSLAVALYYQKDLSTPVILQTSLEKPTTTVKGKWACPSFIYPNSGDQAFAHVELDAQSLAFARKNLSRLPDDLLRLDLWGQLWQSVRESTLPLKNYIELVNAQIDQEKNENVLQQITASVQSHNSDQGSILEYWPMSSPERAIFTAALETRYQTRLQQSTPGSDGQIFWFETYAEFAQSTPALERLATWAKDRSLPQGLKMDVDQRWVLARQLMRFQNKEGVTLTHTLTRKDVSERGQAQALMADAIQPLPAIKSKWIRRLKTKEAFADQKMETVLSTLFPLEQQNLRAEFSPDFYSFMKQHGRSENEGLVKSVVHHLTPLNCHSDASQQLRSFIDAQPAGFSPVANKALTIELVEDERCQKIQSAFSTPDLGNTVAQ